MTGLVESRLLPCFPDQWSDRGFVRCRWYVSPQVRWKGHSGVVGEKSSVPGTSPGVKSTGCLSTLMGDHHRDLKDPSPRFSVSYKERRWQCCYKTEKTSVRPLLWLGLPKWVRMSCGISDMSLLRSERRDIWELGVQGLILPRSRVRWSRRWSWGPTCKGPWHRYTKSLHLKGLRWLLGRWWRWRHHDGKDGNGTPYSFLGITKLTWNSFVINGIPLQWPDRREKGAVSEQCSIRRDRTRVSCRRRWVQLVWLTIVEVWRVLPRGFLFTFWEIVLVTFQGKGTMEIRTLPCISDCNGVSTLCVGSSQFNCRSRSWLHSLLENESLTTLPRTDISTSLCLFGTLTRFRTDDR